ncbi:MAG: glycosyltransferase family 39 protein [Endomicrobiales bacterium]|nr:glycosyltransferase family 39 protein [Endomicrobiales bacterium]
MNKNILIAVSALTLMSLFFNFSGIGTGLPSEEKTALVLGDPELLPSLLEVLAKSREDVYEKYKEQFKRDVPQLYVPDERPVVIEAPSGKKEIESIKIHSIRSIMMQPRFPDEQKAMLSIGRIRPARRDFDPKFYTYGGAYIYPVGITLKIAQILGMIHVSGNVEHYFSHPRDMKMLYVVAKSYGALMIALGIPLIFLCARELYGESAGLLAAIMLAVIPCLPIEAHSVKPHGVIVTMLLVPLYFSARILKYGRTADYILAGAASGLCAGTMIYTGASILSPLAAYLICLKSQKPAGVSPKMLPIAAVLASFVAAFILVNPYYLLNFKGMIWEFTYLSKVVPFEPSLSNFLHHFVYEFHVEFGYLLYSLSVAGFLYSMIKLKKENLIVIPVILVMYFYISGGLWYTSHYDMPMVPYFVLLSAWFASEMAGKFSKYRLVVNSVLALIITYTLMNNVFYAVIIRSHDGYLNEAGRWINENIPENADVGTRDFPFYGYVSDGGYPPFSTIRLRINKKDVPTYYLSVNDGDPKLRDAEFLAGYRIVREFRRKRNVLDKIFVNYRIKFLDNTVRVFEKKA